MANRFTLPRATALDANGDPLSGARLYFYESGTTTPLDSFADRALTAANSNPVVADSAGRFGEIWLKAQDYKVILKDAADVTIWSADPVQGVFTIVGDDFKPGESDPADMTVALAAGSFHDMRSGTRVVKPAQTSAVMVAPSVNPRHDIAYVDRVTGAVGLATGVEAASPADPAIPAGALPVARIRLATTATEITDSLIDDIRELDNLGGVGTGEIQGQAYCYAADSGVAGAYAIALSPAPAAYAAGQRFVFRAANANSGAATLDVDSLGAMPIVHPDGQELQAGDIPANGIVEVVYDGTDFVFVSRPARAGMTRGDIAGLELSNSATDAAHDIDIAAGRARDGDDTADLVLAAPITKQIDLPWAAGSDAGGLDSGAVAADRWYHVWLIRRSDSGAVDALFSLSAAAPAMPAVEWDLKRRIGAVLTDGSANIVAFAQHGDRFTWRARVQDVVDASPNHLARDLAAMSVPTGIGVTWVGSIRIKPNGTTPTAAWTLVTSPEENDIPATAAAADCRNTGVANAEVNSNMERRTDSSAQIGYRVNVNLDKPTVYLETRGWIDPRGKDS